jgi:hypothetical protein
MRIAPPPKQYRNKKSRATRARLSYLFVELQKGIGKGTACRALPTPDSSSRCANYNAEQTDLTSV